jgi:hypothetical protein
VNWSCFAPTCKKGNRVVDGPSAGTRPRYSGLAYPVVGWTALARGSALSHVDHLHAPGRCPAVACRQRSPSQPGEARPCRAPRRRRRAWGLGPRRSGSGNVVAPREQHAIEVLLEAAQCAHVGERRQNDRQPTGIEHCVDVAAAVADDRWAPAVRLRQPVADANQWLYVILSSCFVG